MKARVALLTALAILCVAVTAWGDDTANKAELAKFQGTWEIVAWQIDGKPVPPENYRDIRRIVNGDKALWKTDKGPFADLTLRIDATKTPKTLDSTFNSGDSKGKSLLSIFEDIDDHQMRFAVAPPEKPRPSEFASRPGSGEWLLIFRRID